MLRFDEIVNDLDIISRLKYTKKGPNSLGGTSSRNITKRQRDLHYSMLGKIEMGSASNSDPGSILCTANI